MKLSKNKFSLKKKLSLNQFKFYICELGMLSLFITVLL